jgi:UDP-glucose 4-epimerase
MTVLGRACMQDVDDRMGERVVVTGASGFIGSHLCPRLVASGAEVHAVSRVKHTGNGSVRWWQGDLAELTTARELLRAIKPDVIFHLAGHVQGARTLELIMPTFRSNLASTVNLMTAASEVGCRRIVLTNSMEEPPLTNGETVPSSPYAAAKWASSAYARMFHALFHLPVVILRVFMVYGPGQQDLRKLVPYVIMSLLRGEPPRLTPGQRMIDWVYVDDVVDGLVAAAAATGVHGMTVDIGSGELISIRAVVEHLIRLVGVPIDPLFGALAERPLEQTRVADTVRSHALLGWQPKTGMYEGLSHTVGWYRRRFTEGVLERRASAVGGE